MGSDQRANEFKAGFIGAEDVSGEADMEPRAFDGGKHLRVSLIAAIENGDHLACHNVPAGDLPDRRLEAFEWLI